MATASKPSLLRGSIVLNLQAARNLPESGTIHGVFKKNTTDPYVTVEIGEVRLIKSTVVYNSVDPVWDEEFSIPVCAADTELIIKVCDKDMKTGMLAQVRLSCKELSKGKQFTGWQYMMNEDLDWARSTIKFDLTYTAYDSLPKTLEVPDCYFPIRKQSNLTLYQDAHNHSENNGKEAPKAFEDMYNSILTAKKFIYISGSLDPDFKLVRNGKWQRLDKLLIRKAKSGCIVLVLFFDEQSPLIKVKSFEEPLNAEKVKERFKRTGVKVCITSRTKDKDGYLKGQIPGTCYSHNQKCVILDTPDYAPNSKKRCIAAFMGGLDLKRGRWDTPDHHLFQTLEEEHEGDVYQSTAQGCEELGPRLPWHDMHCKVEGRGAYDILKNFEERWKRQALKKISYLAKITSSKYILRGSTAHNKSNKWTLQLFRSINVDSCLFNPEREYTLKSDQGRLVDDSLHRAMVHHIRRSARFLYIETERFMGRCWKSGSAAMQHLVALEIVGKICEKIFAGERYAVYVVVPLHPEGDPASASVQEMLYWQVQTIEMMYKMISKALKKKGGEGARVTDYLNFYCLGQRVSAERGPWVEEPDKLAPATKNRRCMVYVHSNLLIVDDEYLLLGTGSISQKSLSGKRDTELSIGAWQPKHTQENLNGKPYPKGQVHSYRLSLWAEHTAVSNPLYKRPYRLDCVREVNRIANENWRQYSSLEQGACNASHLIKYPIAILNTGQVVARKDCKVFPDTNAKTLGRRQRYPSEKLTT